MQGVNKQSIGMNVLITSISKKVPLIKAVKRAKAEIGDTGVIFGADVNEQCVGRYFVDVFWKMPDLTALCISELIEYCTINRIFFIVPTRDGELAYFAQHKKILQDNGISVMVSKLSLVKMCLDKLDFYQQGLAMGFPVIPTFTAGTQPNLNSYVVKERFGAGAQALGLQLSKEQVDIHAEKLACPIFQPFIRGREFSVDVYVDINGKAKGAIARTRDVIVNGESQITTTVRESGLEQMCLDFAERLGLYGHAVFQVIVDNEGVYHVVECNSRFGGASTLSIAAGLKSFYWFFLESIGRDLSSYPFIRTAGDLKQIRYAEDVII